MEYESRRFIDAFGLSFSLAGVTDALVERALRKPPPNVLNALAGGKEIPSAQAPSAATAAASGAVGGGGGMAGAAGEDGRRIAAGEVLARRGLGAIKVVLYICGEWNGAITVYIPVPPP